MSRSSPEHHEMMLESTDTSETQRWHCPECGRRLLMKTAADGESLEVVVLQEGARWVPHRGSYGDVSIDGLALVIAPGSDRPPPGYRLH
jgi:hypothetical protein